jgi:hypothetical protein
LRDKSPIILIFGVDWVATAILCAEYQNNYRLLPFPTEGLVRICDLGSKLIYKPIFLDQKHDKFWLLYL